MACVFLVSLSSSASLFPSQYDSEFKDAGGFLPTGIDYRLLKAQCYQESLLNPYAVSPVGAAGLCQFMPGTWSEMEQDYPTLLEAGKYSPEASIIAAALYMNKLHKVWSTERPVIDRHMFALASYNWGAGNVIKSQRRCDGETLYKDVEPCISPKETKHYVRVIVTKWYPLMLFE